MSSSGYLAIVMSEELSEQKVHAAWVDLLQEGGGGATGIPPVRVSPPTLGNLSIQVHVCCH